MATFKTTGGGTYTLQSSIGSTDTSITLTSFTEPISGTPYTMAIIGSSIVYGTIAPKSTSSEFISFTGITQNADGTATLTGVTRGIGRSSPYTSSSTYKLPHAGQSIFILSDAPPVFNQYGALVNSEAITGYWSCPDPIGMTDLANKQWVLSVVSGGTVSVNRVVAAGLAGETVAAGNLLYFKQSDGYWWKTDADTVATMDNVQLGIAQGSGTAGNAISGGVLLSGVDTNNTGTGGAYGYVSNTAGAIGTSAGTNSMIVGQFLNSLGGFYFNPMVYSLPTIAEGLALAGSQGIPGSANKYVTQDNVSTGLTDQTQTTQNGTIAVGEANTTTLKNKIAQSFIPTYTKIRGVNLYKSADTGTFTGTVTVSLQADSSGSPSGSDLASVTISNLDWTCTRVGAFTATFSSAYSSMTASSLYWIVITTSTSDTSNHPNIGTNTAGGYSSGSVKYNNTTDGWVAVSTIDLYFETLQGTASQLVATNTSGKIENTFYDLTEMPAPAFPQTLGITFDNVEAFATMADGSAFFTFQTNDLTRWAKNSSGMYFKTHSINPTIANAQQMIVIGDYLYICNDTGNLIISRFLAADLTGETAMTLPVVPDVKLVWTDGTKLYLVTATTPTTVNVWSVSGTTFSAVTTSATDNFGGAGDITSMYDGVNIWIADNNGAADFANFQVTELSDIYNTTQVTTDFKFASGLSSLTGMPPVIINIDSTRMYIGNVIEIFNSAAAYAYQLVLIPITKP